MEENKKKISVIHIENEIISYVEPDLPDPGAGKVYRRKSDGLIFYGPVYLGKRLYSSKGTLLKNPVPETADDYEIVDAPKTEEWL